MWIRHAIDIRAFNGIIIQTHLKTRFASISPPSRKSGKMCFEMAFMHKKAGDATGTAVQVLVATPGSEISIPIVKFQNGIANGMSQIKAYNAALNKRQLIFEN